MCSSASNPLPSPIHFRLLSIKARSSAGDPIECTLKSFSLACPPPYSALSYAWGNLELKESIIVDGRAVPVTGNLLRALSDLPLNQHHVVWADAVCINQHDIVERNEQVRLMRHIFSRAQRVLAWLGDKTLPGDERSSSREIMPWLNRLAEMETQSRNVAILQQTPNTQSSLVKAEHDKGVRSQAELDALMSVDLSQERPVVVPQQSQGSLTSMPDTRWEPTRFYNVALLREEELIPAAKGIKVEFLITPILTSDWVTRAWVLQEVCLARACFLFWSDGMIPWETFTKALRQMQSMRTSPSYHLSAFLVKDDIRRIVKVYKVEATGETCPEQAVYEFTPIQCLQALSASSDLLSTDPKDKIYSLLGLTDPLEPTNVVPNYAEDARSLYIRFAVELLRKYGPSFLTHVDNHNNPPKHVFIPKELRDLPSWVPDWISKSCTSHLLWTQYQSQLDPTDSFRHRIPMALETKAPTRGDRTESHHNIFTINTQSEKLTLQGTITNIIDRVGPVNPWVEARDVHSLPPPGSNFMTTLSEWIAMLSKIEPGAAHRKLLTILRGLSHDPAATDASQRYAREATISRDWGMLVSHLLSAVRCGGLGADGKSRSREILAGLDLWTQQDFSRWNVATTERRLAIAGFEFGFAPADTRSGDAVVLFKGCEGGDSTRFVVRGERREWRLIGACELGGQLENSSRLGFEPLWQDFVLH